VITPSTDPVYAVQVPQRKPDYSIDSAESWRAAFHVFSREFLSTAIEGNSYVMTVQSDGSRAFFSSSPWDGLGDITVQASGRVREPPVSAWGVQLVTGSHKLARVLVATGGMVKIDLSRLHGADAANLPLDPTQLFLFPHRAIPGADGRNTLLVDVHDHKMSVLMNGQPVGTNYDISSLGTTTLVLVAEGNVGTVATFDSLRVWMPQPKSAAP
jgi:hypothetical protein